MKGRITKCEKRGTQCEHRFAAILQKRGNKTREATYEQDRTEHWDVATLDNDNRIVHRFDVKASKGGCDAAGSVLLEVKNIAGYPGWIYGKADYIAFELDNGDFKVFARTDLVDFLETKYLHADDVSLKREKPRYGYAVNNFYGRPDRKDLFIFIDLDYLCECVDAIDIRK